MNFRDPISGQKRGVLRFYALEPQSEPSINLISDYKFILDGFVSKFKAAMNPAEFVIPVDTTIAKKQMDYRLERSCLLFESHERIMKVLTDLRDLHVSVARMKYFLPLIPGLTNNSLQLLFDLDHIFLVHYTLKNGRVVKLEGFHVDHNNEIEALGKEDPTRLQIEKKSKGILGIEEVNVRLDNCNPITKTFFPRNWTWRKCIEKVFEALENIRDVDVNGKNLNIWGITREKIVIKLVIHKKIGKVITFYPHLVETRNQAKGILW